MKGKHDDEVRAPRRASEGERPARAWLQEDVREHDVEEGERASADGDARDRDENRPDDAVDPVELLLEPPEGAVDYLGARREKAGHGDIVVRAERAIRAILDLEFALTHPRLDSEPSSRTREITRVPTCR